MPWGDGTGPMGLGPMTGRGAGYCAGYNVPGYMNPIPGFGRGFGRGWGRGFGRGWGRGFWWRGYYPPYYSPVYRSPTFPNTEDEKRYLEETIKGLEEELKNLKDRLQELSKKEAP